MDEQGLTAYVTTNPVMPALLARAENRIKRSPKETTSDKDVLQRRWLPVDLDPVRPSDVSATDEEKRATLLRAREIREYLRGQGWSEPVVGDSGNGAPSFTQWICRTMRRAWSALKESWTRCLLSSKTAWVRRTPSMCAKSAHL